MSNAIKYLLIRHQRYVKMCCCGLGSLLVQIIIFNILRLYYHEAIANAIAAEIAIIVNFFMNNWFSFNDRRLSKANSWRIWLLKFGQFNLITLGSLMLQTIIIVVGIRLLGSSILTANLLLFMGIVVGSLTNFYLYKTAIWKPI